MKGSEHNDAFVFNKDQLSLRTNNSGGSLGGVSSG
jgi:chorismate synthase